MPNQNVNVLIVGSGGREHAIAWKIKSSKYINNLYVCPGNAGTKQIATNINCDINDFDAIKKILLNKKIDIMIVGPEAILVNGINDEISSDNRFSNLIIVGPKKYGAKMEGSKFFAKQFMQKYNIPTASFKCFNKEQFHLINQHLSSNTPPYVIKADGLAAGKGVFICHTIEDATRAVEDIIIEKRFGEAGNKIIIDQFLEGTELSVFILTNGHEYKLLPIAKDYKRIGENDRGLNTGGMGAISPVPFANQDFIGKIKKRVIDPTLEGLKKEKIPYSGFLFFGLINVNGEPMVIEYNVRLGDPETQAIMPRIDCDLLEILSAMNNESLFNRLDMKIKNDNCASVIVSSGGYPEKYKTNMPIKGLDKDHPSTIFHAGVKFENKIYKTNGGRVLAITSLAPSLKESVKKSYMTLKNVWFRDMYFRKDIGSEFI